MHKYCSITVISPIILIVIRVVRHMSRPPFHLKVRIGEMEVELGGDKAEVLSTLDELPSIVEKVSASFQGRIHRP